MPGSDREGEIVMAKNTDRGGGRMKGVRAVAAGMAGLLLGLGAVQVQAGAATPGFVLTSPAFKEGEKIPARFTCDGENVSPPLRWEGAPAGTKSFILEVKDPDARGGTWIHWIVYNIPGTASALSEGVKRTEYTQGRNSWRAAEYGGPCPPYGSNRYFFRLRALGVDRIEQAGEADRHTLGETVLMGRYR